MWQALLDICTSGSNGLLEARVAADITIGLSYYVMPPAIFWVWWQRRADLTHWQSALFIGFTAFIFSCGSTHFQHTLQTLAPGPWQVEMDTWFRVVTAAVSAITAGAVVQLAPTIVRIMEAAAGFERLNVELEARVVERTTENASMIRELHHYGGNDIQQIMSGVNLLKRQISDEDARMALIVAEMDKSARRLADMHEQVSSRILSPLEIALTKP